MQDLEVVPIERIYVPIGRRDESDPLRARQIAERILDGEVDFFVRVRRDQDRFILLDGVDYLEACKALGETSVMAITASAERKSRERPIYEVEAELQRPKTEQLRKLRLKQQVPRSISAELPICGPNRRSGGLTESSRSEGARKREKKKTLDDWLRYQKDSGGRF